MLCTSARHYPLLSTGVQPRKTRPDMTEKLLTGITLVNVYVDLVVFTRIAGTS